MVGCVFCLDFCLLLFRVDVDGDAADDAVDDTALCD